MSTLLSALILLQVGAPDAGPEAAPASPAGDTELRAQLAQALELLARHDEALRALTKDAGTTDAGVADAGVATASSAAPAHPVQRPWYERLSVRGYTQLRYNLPGIAYNDKLINEQGDRSLGGNGGFLIRRARLILFGEVFPGVSVYLQPDFASVIGEQLGVAILRDWYADIFFDAKKEFRLRVGQSKVPFGFENMQSSQNRLPLDRNDALNSAVKDERDLGLFFYWAPAVIRERFKFLVDSGLKGSGDYGVVGLGVYNGQTANRPELNKAPHGIARVTWPFLLGGQILELGGGGYVGQATVALGTHPDGTRVTSARADNTFLDARGHVSAVLYPQPLGLTVEYNVGVGPQLGARTPYEIGEAFLYGGYALASLKLDGVLGTVALLPFVRGTMYDGGKKFVTNSPKYHVREVEFGVEWQIAKGFEFVVAYLMSNRTSDKTYTNQTGHWTRLQLQVNY